MKKLCLMFLFLPACTLEVPVDEIEVPPIENNTTIVVNLPDGLSYSVPAEEAADAESRAPAAKLEE